jgi:hypothetical protein
MSIEVSKWLTAAFATANDRYESLSKEQKYAVGAVGGLTGAYLATRLWARATGGAYAGAKPTAFEITGATEHFCFPCWL